MSHERLLVDLIEDFDDLQILQNARHELLITKKNILNIRKNKAICIRENTDSQEKMQICQNRIDFINADIHSFRNLKDNIEAQIAQLGLVESDSLPIVYDPLLELFIDQKIEYYTNNLVRHRSLTDKKHRICAYIRRLQKILEDQKKELANSHELVAKYNNWIPELRSKQLETSAELTTIQSDIVAFLEGSRTVSQEISFLIKRRFDMMQDVLEHKMRTLMQLNEFSHHIQSECVKYIYFIADLNEKNELVQEEINKTIIVLNETNTDLQTAEMKYRKVEQQIYKYIQIQEEFNTINKCRAYYDLISTYEQEKVNAQSILDTFLEKHINEVVQLSSLESNLENLLEKKRRMENTITSLLNGTN